MEAAYFEPINLGNPNELTILEFAQRILRLAKSTGKVVFRPLPEDDPKTRKPDITRARELLAWEPRIDLAVGLERTLRYFSRRDLWLMSGSLAAWLSTLSRAQNVVLCLYRDRFGDDDVGHGDFFQVCWCC